MQLFTYLIVFLLIGAVIAVYVSWSHGLLVFPTWTGLPVIESEEGFKSTGSMHSKQNKNKNKKESFSAPPANLDPAIAAAVEKAAYDSRIYVMQTFEAVLHRKPTNAEVVKYSAYGPSQSSILNAIVQDNPPTQSPDGCGDVDSCALPVLAGSNDEACDSDSEEEDEESDEESESESDDDYGLPSNVWKRPTADASKAPRPYAPTGRVTYDRPDVPSIPNMPNIQVTQQMATPQPCLDRMDVLKRLQAISDDVENFKKYVTML